MRTERSYLPFVVQPIPAASVTSGVVPWHRSVRRCQSPPCPTGNGYRHRCQRGKTIMKDLTVPQAARIAGRVRREHSESLRPVNWKQYSRRTPMPKPCREAVEIYLQALYNGACREHERCNRKTSRDSAEWHYIQGNRQYWKHVKQFLLQFTQKRIRTMNTEALINALRSIQWVPDPKAVDS